VSPSRVRVIKRTPGVKFASLKTEIKRGSVRGLPLNYTEEKQMHMANLILWSPARRMQIKYKNYCSADHSIDKTLNMHFPLLPYLLNVQTEMKI
jgi:hypothetical protein